ncbi:hypothetical protein [Cytobacillus sp.]|uniref:hypothetical protein n=1 Tax=Cytobacillus sp. TaxID=2675269 RepID=UPI00351914FA
MITILSYFSENKFTSMGILIAFTAHNISNQQTGEVFQLKGIYLINPHWQSGNKSKQECAQAQKQALETYIEDYNIFTVKLNQWQLNDYYTIPHALLYDLKQKKPDLDILLLYSEEVLEDFINSYPARWLILKSFFNEVVFAAKQKENYFEGAG